MSKLGCYKIVRNFNELTINFNSILICNPRKHSSRMRTSCSPPVPLSVTSHQMSVTEGILNWTMLNGSPVLVMRCHWQSGDWSLGQGSLHRGPGRRVPTQRGWGWDGQVQGIRGNDQMGPPLDRQTPTHDWKHYLSTTSLVGGNKNSTEDIWMCVRVSVTVHNDN